MQHKICRSSIIASCAHRMHVLHTHACIPISPCFSLFCLTPGSNYDIHCMPKASEVLPAGRTQWERLNIAMGTSDTENSAFSRKGSTSRDYQQKNRKVSVFRRSVKKKLWISLQTSYISQKVLLSIFHFRNLFEIIPWPLPPSSACVGSPMDYIGQANPRRQTVNAHR